MELLCLGSRTSAMVSCRTCLAQSRLLAGLHLIFHEHGQNVGLEWHPSTVRHTPDLFHLLKSHLRVATPPACGYALTLADKVRVREGLVIRQPSDDVVELFIQAAQARELLMQMLSKMAEDFEAEECIVAPLKSMFRAYEKVWFRNELTRGQFESVLDFARGALFFHEVRDITRALQYIERSDKVRIVRVKQRLVKFENDPDSGPTGDHWRDILLNVVFVDDPDQHIAEIQLGYSKLLVGTGGYEPSFDAIAQSTSNQEDEEDDAESTESHQQKKTQPESPSSSSSSRTAALQPKHPMLVAYLARDKDLSFDWTNLRVGPYGWLRTAREQLSAIAREDLGVVSRVPVDAAADGLVPRKTTSDERFPVIYKRAVAASPKRNIETAIGLEVSLGTVWEVCSSSSCCC